jgi:hypothetical protein
MKKLLLAAALLASTPAFAWTYETDDGRQVTPVQVNRDVGACDMIPGNQFTWLACMRSKGYVTHHRFCDWFVCLDK